MAHDHGASDLTNTRRLVIAIAITASVFVLEVVGALVSGSLALLADAGHMLSDLTALVIALIAIAIAGRPASDRRSYGSRRAEVFAALVNGLILLGVVGFVAIEGVGRLLDPAGTVVLGTPMLIVAAIGGLANVASLLVLRGGRKNSINMRGAYLEVLGDLVGSIAVIIAAVIILLTGFVAADGIASLVVAGLIVPRALSLLREATSVLAESTPRGTDVDLIRDHVLRTPGAVGVHDVHVWAITPGVNVFSAHVVVEPRVFSEGGAGRMLDALGLCLADHFDVEHSTFQLEPAEHAAHEEHGGHR
ncbi:cation diffusion facilitator family transporter [Marisediminicola antarctica]|uniref:Cation transporter n=1 Tax=Marisediminicola antarctica TaxID=674079 RepID=A0A7L5AFS6_9MICO|nr:cation diffusion facilitator family transporter [Marisediminicola antarctica]QHO68816.1 cation transporter [Marisediminicola antarctica]